MKDMNETLQSMEIPAMRRDTTKPENLRWLLRNLPINNANHADLAQVMEQIRQDLDGAKDNG